MIRICRNHTDAPTEPLFTFAFPDGDYWCPRCGTRYKIDRCLTLCEVEHAKPLTDDETQRAARYLFAVQCSNRDRVKMGGKWIRVRSLPACIRRENSEIIKNWRYEICVTQS